MNDVMDGENPFNRNEEASMRGIVDWAQQAYDIMADHIIGMGEHGFEDDEIVRMYGLWREGFADKLAAHYDIYEGPLDIYASTSAEERDSRVESRDMWVSDLVRLNDEEFRREYVGVHAAQADASERKEKMIDVENLLGTACNRFEESAFQAAQQGADFASRFRKNDTDKGGPGGRRGA